MKKTLTILFLFISVLASATDYYVKTGGSDEAAGTSDETAWATITKVNTVWAAGTFAPGDKIYFNRGDTFYGTITTGESGTDGNPITIGAYGTGADPIITGLTALSSWTQVGATNVYYATHDVTRLNIVTIDGDVVYMGRYPDSGYLSYESHTGNTSITDNELTDSPDWTGAEIGIRKYRWVIDRHVVTDHTDGTLTYNALGDYGNNTAYEPQDGNGYFFQNHLGCLDDFGDWYYAAATDRLYIDFGGNNPSGYTIKAGTLARNVTVAHNYVYFENLVFEGTNTCGAYVVGVNHINFNGCEFRNQGCDAIYCAASSYIDINNSEINTALNDGLFWEYEADNCTIDSLTVTNISIYPGSSKSGDGTAMGMHIRGDGNTVTNCIVDSAGYSGIASYGSDVLIKNNLVSFACLIKDDGGGIYVYDGTGSNFTNINIEENIVLNTVGAYAGAEAEYWEAFGKAAGIYLDGYSSDVDVINNVIAHSGWTGIFVNGGDNDTITGNLAFNNANHAQLQIMNTTSYYSRGLSISNNYFIAKASGQYSMYINDYNINDDPGDKGTFDYNCYARPIDDDTHIFTYRPNTGNQQRTLTGWQTFSGEDANSNGSPIAVSDTSYIDFYYSTTDDNTINLPYASVNMTGTKYSTSITLDAFEGVVLLKDSNPPPPPIVGGIMMRSGKVVMLNGKVVLIP